MVVQVCNHHTHDDCTPPSRFSVNIFSPFFNKPPIITSFKYRRLRHRRFPQKSHNMYINMTEHIPKSPTPRSLPPSSHCSFSLHPPPLYLYSYIYLPTYLTSFSALSRWHTSAVIVGCVCDIKHNNIPTVRI